PGWSLGGVAGPRDGTGPGDGTDSRDGTGPGDGAGSRPHSISVAAVAVVFAAAGITMASALSRMPEIKDRVDASATQLAFALVFTGIGSIIAMPFAGRLVARFGTARIVGIFAVIASIGWALIPLAGT